MVLMLVQCLTAYMVRQTASCTAGHTMQQEGQGNVKGSYSWSGPTAVARVVCSIGNTGRARGVMSNRGN